MVTPTGLSISVSQARISGVPGQPIPVSGRVTAFGLGVPALVRIRLEGPRQTDFTTFAGLTGNYQVDVTPEVAGAYLLRAQAFPPLPGLANILPPIAESSPTPGGPGFPMPEFPGPRAELPSPSVTVPVTIEQLFPAAAAEAEATTPILFQPPEITRRTLEPVALAPITFPFEPTITEPAQAQLVGFSLE
ncbi:MAG: hypothetical protein Q8R28_07900 [Dehalococcoidia bacterium]|nr:hypothetical protein [Dehalococcoidia bacterium]